MAEPALAFGELLKLVVALGVTIGLFYALALFMKRLQLGTGRSGTLITVLAALPLGGKEKIWVVDVAGEKLVIGTTPGNVNCLHVLKDSPPSFPRTQDSSVDATEAPSSSFPRTQESSVDATEALSSSFPRKRESSVDAADSGTTLDPGLRRGDAATHSNAAHAFSELLTKFRGWQK